MTSDAHCGKCGHRAYDATSQTVPLSYWKTDVREGVGKLTQSWLRCVVSQTGEWKPKPLSDALHGLPPNEVVRADILYTRAAAVCEFKNLLVIKDETISSTWLHACVNADDDAATNLLSRLFACFRCMEWLGTGQRSHIDTSLMNSLTKELKIRHHSTTRYCPWTNGTVERLCKKGPQITRAFILE